MLTSAKTAPRALALPEIILVNKVVGIRLEVSNANVAMDTDFRVIQYAQVRVRKVNRFGRKGNRSSLF